MIDPPLTLHLLEMVSSGTYKVDLFVNKLCYDYISAQFERQFAIMIKKNLNWCLEKLLAQKYYLKKVQTKNF